MAAPTKTVTLALEIKAVEFPGKKKKDHYDNGYFIYRITHECSCITEFMKRVGPNILSVSPVISIINSIIQELNA